MTAEAQVWMFSGQGSQYYQMGLDLYQSDPEFRAVMDRCSDQVSPLIGTSLTELIFKPRANRFDPFTRTLFTHAALFSVQLSLAHAMLNRGLRPAILMGYSLGEWVAHVVAGVLDADTALDLLVEQARAVEAESPPGGMLAVMAPLEILAAHPESFNDTWVAARNFDRHFVITGAADAISRTQSKIEAQGVTCLRLPVSYAFHSPLMDAFEAPIARSLKAVQFRTPAYRLISCRGIEVTSEEPSDALWKALRQPIRFPEALALIEAEERPTYVDCSPAGTMANFVKYNLPRGERHRERSIMSPFDRNVEKLDALSAPDQGRQQ